MGIEIKERRMKLEAFFVFGLTMTLGACASKTIDKEVPRQLSKVPDVAICQTQECWIKSAELIFVGEVVDFGTAPSLNLLCGSVYLAKQTVTYRVLKVLKGRYEAELIQVRHITCGCELCDGNSLSPKAFGIGKRVILATGNPEPVGRWKKVTVNYSAEILAYRYSSQRESEIVQSVTVSESVGEKTAAEQPGR